MARGKRYLEQQEKYNPEMEYPPDEAIKLVKELASAKFNESIDVHFRLNIDPRQAEEQIRGVIVMPSGLGKTVKVLVFAEGDAERIAREAGADIVGSDELIQTD